MTPEPNPVPQPNPIPPSDLSGTPLLESKPPLPNPTPVVAAIPAATPTDQEVLLRMQRMTRRAFAVGAVSAVTSFLGWTWLQTRSDRKGLPWPFRAMHEANESLGRQLYSDQHLAPEFDRKYAAEPRVNGWIGWSESQPAPDQWTIAVETPGTPARKIALQEFKQLPPVEIVHELKCVEGWSQIVQWEGYRFRDFLTQFNLVPPKESNLRYLRLSTMDGGYSVALDLESAMHPQTMLCHSMNGSPLTEGHGAPIRLIIPVKYGIKNIKWLARLRFSVEKPSDYWTDRGYDWYAGL